MRTVGVEEELLIVQPGTGNPLPLAAQMLARHERSGHQQRIPPLSAELQQEQIECASQPHASLEELGRDIAGGRALAGSLAAEFGAEVAALASSPLPVTPHTSAGSRNDAMTDQFGLTTREQLTCGCHVHVAVESDEEGVAVLDRLGPWLPVLAALSTNSPFWKGSDSGYASFRIQAWSRWPTSGPTAPFGSARAYRTLVDELITSGVPLDRGMIYFDARLSERFPTVEIRVADVCLDADDAVLLAGLTRSLVETAAEDARRGRTPPDIPVPLLRLSSWRASRWGLDGLLMHPGDGRLCPAPEAVAALHRHVFPALERRGDEDLVGELLSRALARGNGARRQRTVFRRSGSLAAVVADAVAAT
ncbi:glutamate--cysteine ligase [Paenarthrobacter sp. DKR-5]|uniref:glutamate--cysteine ligase n=1 Tax=Paenarthrobacter sp. DKR-5 TaxID=2835535 RepID=UPI001BDC09BA|nr:glutamate--cysteine ligase [Paenarthrobacter sp. DKR-5]MBT1001272.1 glutamate--cysteine ligase [Paenarthrobacter sp. DKR-5]